MKKARDFDIRQLIVPLTLLIVFWVIAVLFWQLKENIFFLFNFGYIGTSIAVGLGIYQILPKKKKLWGRRLAQFLVGTYMLIFLGIILKENIQIEGFFVYLLAGIFSGSTIHYLVAKLAGPVIFHRGWCGWSCWTAMILDLLPYRRNKSGRLSRKWENLRYVHFTLSLILVLVLWYGFDYRDHSPIFTPMVWLLVGNTAYYIIGITLAYTLKDNRAFCKYVCPIPVLQKITSRFSMLKVEGSAEKCTECGACEKMCPMDIQISQYTQSHQRVLSTECILCIECVDVCAKDALKISFGFDFGKRELLNRKVS
ncbi:MAG TPA: 4Fe-4S dicluster domain-containing protein [Anaerolineales bacterium]|nr:4Fe-4S dicluster domain-containing protein [Anaerolineales bacterium]